MKKLILSFVLLMGVSSINAQTIEEVETFPRNDIFIDPVTLVAVPTLNVSYERLLNKDSGLGVNAVIGIGSISKDFNQISPYYRMYFGKKYARGFFFDGFIPITMMIGTIYNGSDYTRKTYTTVGIGVGFGSKWELKRNLMFELSGGLGRKFGASEGYFDAPITGRLMIGLGKRF